MQENLNEDKLKDDIADILNTIAATRGIIKRIIIWHSRLDSKLVRLEEWLRKDNNKYLIGLIKRGEKIE